MNCPKCDKEMEHQDYEPDVGIMCGGFFCTACDVWVDDAEIDHSDDLYT